MVVVLVVVAEGSHQHIDVEQDQRSFSSGRPSSTVS